VLLLVRSARRNWPSGPSRVACVDGGSADGFSRICDDGIEMVSCAAWTSEIRQSAILCSANDNFIVCYARRLRC